MPKRRRRWVAGGAALALGCAIVGGDVLPDWGLRWGVGKTLRELGWSRVGIGAAEIELFNGAIVVRRVVAGDMLGEALGIGGLDLTFRWTPLLSRRVSLEQLDLKGVEVEVRRSGTGFVINGLPVALGTTGETGAWTFDVTTLKLADSRFVFMDGGFKAAMDVDSFELHDLKSWDSAAAARFRLAGRLNGSRVTLDGTASPFADRAAFALKIEVDALDLAAFEELARRAGMAPPAGHLTGNLALEGAIGEPLTAEGHLAFSNLSAGMGGLAFEAGTAAWTGRVALDLATKSSSLYQADGRAEVADARIRAGDLDIAARKAAAEGSLADAPAQGMLPALAGALNLSAEGVSASDPSRDWLAAQRIEARDLHLAAGAPARLGRLEAKDLAVLGRKGKGPGFYPWRVEARSLVLDHGTVTSEGGLAADDLSLGGAVLRVTRTKDGMLGFESGGGSGDAPRLALGRFNLSAQSRLRFEDRTAPEPVRLVAEGLELSMAELDSQRPDQDSPFSVKARVGAAQISAHGSARPFAARPGGSLEGTIRALELPPLSPYAAEALGVHLHTGQLDAEVALSARSGKLDGSMQLALSRLFIAQPDPAAPLAKHADMPLETVLDLLRDGEGRISLTIPIRGDLDAPDFDISDAVNQAIGGALKSTVITTLKVAFPVAALIGFVIDEAENPRMALAPLAFPPGADTLAEAERTKLATVAGLLGQRPGLKLTLCGVATQHADWPVLLETKRIQDLGLVAKFQKLIGAAPEPDSVPADRDRLARLADSRAQAAKTFLIEQNGIDPGRLFTCRPKVEGETKTGPRVDLLL